MDGEVSCAAAYVYIRGPDVHVSWEKHGWAAYIPLSSSILTWRVLHGKLSTDVALRDWGFIFPSRCRLCSATKEDL